MKDPTGLTAAQARKIVRPFKPQPSKRPDDRGGPFGVAPPAKPPVKATVEKPVVKAPPKPPAAPPAPPQAPPQQSFDDFLKGLFGGQQAPQEQQSFNDFISQFFQPQQQPDYKSILEQLFAPVNQQYQQQLGGLNQFNSSQNEAVKSFTSQLANQLQGMGDSVYTPELAGALGLEAQREASWSQYGNQQKLYDNLIGGFQQDLPDMFGKIVDSYGQQAPSTSDLIQLRKLYDDENQGGAGGLDPQTILSALGAYNNTYGSPFEQQKAADAAGLAQQKLADTRANQEFARKALATKLGLTQAKNENDFKVKAAQLKQSAWYKQATVAQRQQAINAIAVKNKTVAQQSQQKIDLAIAKYRSQIDQFNAKQKSTAAKATQPNAAISGKVGYLADSNGNPLTTKSGDLQVLPGFTIKGGKVVKVGSAAAKKASLTPNQQARYRGTALTIAENAYKGFVDDKGTPHPAIDYRPAIREMEKEGVPFTIALKAANRFFKPGQRGRPYPSPTRDVGFRSASVKPKKK